MFLCVIDLFFQVAVEPILDGGAAGVSARRNPSNSRFDASGKREKNAPATPALNLNPSRRRVAPTEISPVRREEPMLSLPKLSSGLDVGGIDVQTLIKSRKTVLAKLCGVLVRTDGAADEKLSLLAGWCWSRLHLV